MADQQVSGGAKSIFLEALRFKEPRERAAFLDAACLSSNVDREQVEQLLDAVRDGAPDPLEQAAEWIAREGVSRCLTDGDGKAFDGSPEKGNSPARTIGPYALVRMIGEGGMGVVYLAEQSHPVRRQVALKVVKPGMDFGQFSARFESERQTLSIMDHPHIARLLDVGTTDQGLPYFAMELVWGVPITTYCRKHGLSIAKRLELFCDVCDAIQHAHQKGIIHRDLKPSNLLVQDASDREPGEAAGNSPSALQASSFAPSERPVVKVIDFGIAKALHPLADDATQPFTGVHGFIGTPMYMSPEQVDPETFDIDTRSDVYSLGVVLYELLAEAPPYDPDQMKRSTMEDLRKIISEREPSRPSTRILKVHRAGKSGGPGSTETTVLAGGEPEERTDDPQLSIRLSSDQTDTECLVPAAHRDEAPSSRLEPEQARERSRLLRRELDWIVMRAMEKDRQRRYQSPQEFAADIRRFIEGEPVQACPPSTWYRLRKLARRHRAALLTTLLILLSLLVGLSTAIGQAVRAMRAEQLAEQRLQEARRSRLATQQLLYASDVELAGLAWQRNDVGRMRELLAKQIPQGSDQPDFRGFEWHLLWKQSEVETKELLAVEKPLYCICVSPDGELLATSGADARIYLLETENWQLLRTIETGQVEVNGLHFSPDGTRLASAGDDGSIAYWDPRSGEELLRFHAHDEWAFGVRFSVDGETLVSCSAGPVVKIWRAADGELEETIEYHTNRIEALDLSSNGTLALASRDTRSTVWRMPERELLWEDQLWPESAVSSVNFSSDGRFLVQGQVGGMLSLFAVGPPKEVLARQMLSSGVHAVGISPDSRHVIAGDNIGMIHLFPNDRYGGAGGLSETETSPRARHWQAHDQRIYALAMLADNERIVTAGRDGRLMLSLPHVSAGIAFVDVPGHEFVLRDDQTLITNGWEAHRVRLTPNPSLELLSETKTDEWSDAALARNSREAFVIREQGTVYRVPEAGPLELVYEFPGGQKLEHLAVSPDGGRLAFNVLFTPRHEVNLLYDRHRKEELWRIDTQSTHCLEFTPDGTRVVYGYMDDVRVADAETGELVMTLAGHQAALESLAILPDGRHLATGSLDRTLRIWDLTTGKEVWSVVAHENRVDAIAAHPNGRTIVTAGRDGMLRFWRWRIRRLVCEIPATRWGIGKMAFTPDGTRLITNHGEHGLVIYDGSPTPVRTNDR
jgi:eukaryotic-like serine/threonine-protein kinase